MGIIEGGGSDGGPDRGPGESEWMNVLGVTAADVELDFGNPPAVRLARLDTKIKLLQAQRDALVREIEDSTAETTDRC